MVRIGNIFEKIGFASFYVLLAECMILPMLVFVPFILNFLGNSQGATSLISFLSNRVMMLGMIVAPMAISINSLCISGFFRPE